MAPDPPVPAMIWIAPSHFGLGWLWEVDYDDPALNAGGHTRTLDMGIGGTEIGGDMRSQIEFALAHPVYDPERQIILGHGWVVERLVSAFLTVNIGDE
jgi:hypothetical protein